MEGLGDLAGLFLKAGAPLISGVLKSAATAAGGPAAGVVAGVVLDAAAKALGANSASPTDVAAAITADPVKAAEVLPRVENDHLSLLEAQNKIDEAHMADVANARQQTIALVQSGSALAWGAPVVSVIVTVGFFGCIALLFFGRLSFTELSGQIMLILTGSLTAGFNTVISYWLGSSISSANKSAQIAQLAHTAMGGSGDVSSTPPPAIFDTTTTTTTTAPARRRQR